MVTGNPIITPNYPATRDLLNTNNCFFAEPEDSASLIKTIKEVLENEEKAKLIGQQALKDVQGITFENVTNRIFNALKLNT
jgi:glycosyltransferase involved in cell wall biosynthesis